MPFGPYAPDAHFDTGLSDRDWHASWIRRGGALAEAVRRVLAVAQGDDARRRHDRPRPRVRGRRPAVRTARQRHAARANGPSFSYPDEQYYETTDVTKPRPAGCAQRVRVRHPLVDRGPGTAAVARGVHRAHHGRLRRRIPRVVSRPTRTWRTHTGPWIPGTFPATTKATSSNTSTNASTPSGWDRARFRRPRLAAGRPFSGRHPWTLFRHLVRGATPHRLHRRGAGLRSNASPTARTSPTSARSPRRRPSSRPCTRASRDGR